MLFNPVVPGYPSHVACTGRACAKHLQAISIRVERQIHQNVDLIRSNPLRQFRIAPTRRITPPMRPVSEPRRKFVPAFHIRIAETLDLFRIVIRNQLHEKPTDRLFAKIRRNITDAQSPPRRSIVAVRTNFHQQRFLEPLRPSLRQLQVPGGVKAGMKKPEVH